MKAQRQIGGSSWIRYSVSGLLALAVVLPWALILCRMLVMEEQYEVESKEKEVDLIDLASGTSNEEMANAVKNIFAWGRMRKTELLFMPDAVLGFTLGVVEKSYAPDWSKGFQHSFALRCEDLKIVPYRGYVCQLPERSMPEVFKVAELSQLPPLERTWHLDFQSSEPAWTVPAAKRPDGIVWRDALGRTWQNAPRLSAVGETLRNKVRSVTCLELISLGKGGPRRVVVRENCGIGELEQQAVQALLQAKPEDIAGVENTCVYIFWNPHCVRMKDKWSY